MRSVVCAAIACVAFGLSQPAVAGPLAITSLIIDAHTSGPVTSDEETLASFGTANALTSEDATVATAGATIQGGASPSLSVATSESSPFNQGSAIAFDQL